MSKRASFAYLMLCGSIVSIAGCRLPPAEGAFRCATPADCPANWYCRADDLCWSTPDDDAAVTQDAHGPDSSVDAGVVLDAALVDATTPECTSDAECPGEIARCQAGRCTLCASPTPELVDIDADSSLRDELDLTAGESSIANEVVLVWRGPGTRIYAHRTPLEAPLAPASVVNATPAIMENALLVGVTEITSIAIRPVIYAGEWDGRVDLAVLGRIGTDSVIGATLFSRSTSAPFAGETYPDHETSSAPDSFLGDISIDGARHVVSRAVAASATIAQSREIEYLGLTYSATDRVPSGAAAIVVADDDVAMFADPAVFDAVYTWEPPLTSLRSIETPDRSGAPSWIGTHDSRFLLAYPAGSSIRVREIGCVAGCAPSALSVALPADSDDIAWVQAGLAAGFPLLLSAERFGTEWRILLRVLRPDLSPLAAPGGSSSIILDRVEMPAQFAIGRVASVAALRAVGAWLERPEGSGLRTLRLTSASLACE